MKNSITTLENQIYIWKKGEKKVKPKKESAQSSLLPTLPKMPYASNMDNSLWYGAQSKAFDSQYLLYWLGPPFSQISVHSASSTSDWDVLNHLGTIPHELSANKPLLIMWFTILFLTSDFRSCWLLNSSLPGCSCLLHFCCLVCEKAWYSPASNLVVVQQGIDLYWTLSWLVYSGGLPFPATSWKETFSPLKPSDPFDLCGFSVPYKI